MCTDKINISFRLAPCSCARHYVMQKVDGHHVIMYAGTKHHIPSIAGVHIMSEASLSSKCMSKYIMHE